MGSFGHADNDTRTPAPDTGQPRKVGGWQLGSAPGNLAPCGITDPDPPKPESCDLGAVVGGRWRENFLVGQSTCRVR